MKHNDVETRLTVGFAPAIGALIEVLAAERAVGAGELIRVAVITMLDAFDGVGDARAPRGDADITVPDKGFRRSRPRCVQVEDVYIDSSTRERLDEFCRAVRLSKARAIRVAVDRYLFDEIVGPDHPDGGSDSSDLR
ncbi:hypothetical protein ACWDSJ_35065 [Nocardia sp. NPDC003482]|uniref:hypothetical protein n=1 Tax=Nocardia sp. NPDC004068 TaxID=3364303 RepID=UPI00369FDE9C